MSITVYPQIGFTYPDALGVPITSVGATVDESEYIRNAIDAGYLLTTDPLGVFMPDDRVDGSSGVVAAFNTAADLSPVLGTAGDVAVTLGATAVGDGGGGFWYWAAGSTATANVGTVLGSDASGRWLRLFSGAFNVKWFGAKGDDTQTLQAVTAYSGFPWTITQQTADGAAINLAIDAVHAAGGGELFFPTGTYRVWGYLKVIGHEPVGGGASYNFRDVTIRGEGIGATVLKCCDTSPVNAHGYGIIQVGVGNGGSHPALIPNSRVTNFHLSDLTLDGNAVTRNVTAGEWWSDNLVFVGWPGAVVERVESINGVRDCVLLNFESDGFGSTPPTIDNGVPSGVRLVDCNLATSWRNTLTIAAGRNVRVTGCRITGGGRVGAGTLPRSCMDIEPDGADYPVQDVVITDTLFEDAPGQLTNVVWSSVRFVNCTFSMIGPFPSGLHWPMISVSSQVDLIGCTFRDTAVRTGYLWYYPTYATGAFVKDEYMQVKDCTFDGCGFLAQGVTTVIDGCDFTNALFPVLIQDSSASMRRVTIRDLNLVNVVDLTNASSGPMAALAIHSTITCPVFIDGVSSVFDPTRAPAGVDFTTDNGGGLVVAHGVCIDPLPAATSEVKVSNVHSAGWYRKYTTYTTTAPSGFCSDWGGGGGGDLGPAPANTAGTQTAPGTVRYANCTYYGDLA